MLEVQAIKTQEVVMGMLRIISSLRGKLLRYFRDCFVTLCFVATLSIPGAQAYFGESCVQPPISDGSGYLASNTVYGLMQSSIDMDGHCSVSGQLFRFCLMNADLATCTIIDLNLGDNVKLSDISTNPNLGGNPLLANLEMSVEIISGALCLVMPTSRGKMPLACRNYIPSSNAPADTGPVCRTLGNSCYDSKSMSQSLLSFSGTAVYCVRDTLDKLFYTGSECNSGEQELFFTLLNPFPAFQSAIKVTITAALILYVIMYGFKVILNHEYTNLNKIASFILKFVFVVYFSIGFGSYYDSHGRLTSRNGMTETALPMMLQLTSDFTEMIFLAGGSRSLCVYDSSKYQPGYEFYKVWDAIDCRIGYYLGMQLLYNLDSSGFLGTGATAVTSLGTSASNAANFGNPGTDGPDVLKKTGVLSFFVVMFGFFMSGNIIIVLCGMIFCIVFLSVIFYFLNIYLVSMVTLYVMAYISPIFVPMLLFERTKSYFDSWVRIVISCGLQPAIVGGFIALLLTMYDSIFYGNCEYLRHDYHQSGISFSTFELREPASEPEKCINSTGYKLVKYYLGQGWEKRNLIIFEIIKISDFLGIAMNMVYMLVYVFIFYFVLQLINEFISDLTGGPSMASVALSPTVLIDGAMAAAAKYRAATSKGADSAELAKRKAAGNRRSSPGNISAGPAGRNEGKSATDNISVTSGDDGGK